MQKFDDPVTIADVARQAIEIIASELEGTYSVWHA
jgi:hypothetical protein